MPPPRQPAASGRAGRAVGAGSHARLAAAPRRTAQPVSLPPTRSLRAAYLWRSRGRAAARGTAEHFDQLGGRKKREKRKLFMDSARKPLTIIV